MAKPTVTPNLGERERARERLEALSFQRVPPDAALTLAPGVSLKALGIGLLPGRRLRPALNKEASELLLAHQLCERTTTGRHHRSFQVHRLPL
jgi:hypothetical protein